MNLKRLQKTIERIGETLPPEGDWMPALLMESKKAFTVFGFMGNPAANDRAKDIMAMQITKSIAEFGPDSICLVQTAWSLDFEKMKASDTLVDMFRRGEIRASQHPDRIEIVSAYCYGEKGENEGEALMIGTIRRFKDRHPTIEKWKIVEDGASAEGRFPDAVKEGFRLAKGG